MDIAHEPIHPGEILDQDFLTPLGITKYRLAKTIGVAPTRIGEIIAGTRAISPDTALRLSRAFGTSERFWSNLQTRYDLQRAHDAHAEEINQIQSLIAS